MKCVEKNHLTSLKLSKFTPSTAQQSAALSDERLKSYSQKNCFFGHFGQNGPKTLFFGHTLLFFAKKNISWFYTCRTIGNCPGNRKTSRFLEMVPPLFLTRQSWTGGQSRGGEKEMQSTASYSTML